MIQAIHTEKSQEPIGPYSQAIKANGFIFCSGVAGVNPQTGELVEGLENQTRQVFANLKEILSVAGSDFSQVVKVTIFLKDMQKFEAMNSVYKEIFGNYQPARTTIEASNLAKAGALIIAELVALEK